MRKRFVPYVDKDLNEAGNEFGKCERINNCGHHQYPRSEPKHQALGYTQTMRTYVHPNVLSILRDRSGTCSFEDALLSWASGHGWADLAGDAIDQYLVCSQNSIKDAKGNAGTAFPFLDFNHNVTDIQFKAYNGLKTCKSAGVNWAHSALRKVGKLPPESSRYRSLFGEHLLNTSPKHVHIFESPKTAIMAQVYFAGSYPEESNHHIFLAAGALTWLQYLCIDAFYIERMKPILAKHLSYTLWPDLSKDGSTATKWNNYARALADCYGGKWDAYEGLSAYASLEDHDSGADLGDFLALPDMPFSLSKNMALTKAKIDFSKYQEAEKLTKQEQWEETDFAKMINNYEAKHQLTKLVDTKPELDDIKWESDLLAGSVLQDEL